MEIYKWSRKFVEEFRRGEYGPFGYYVAVNAATGKLTLRSAPYEHGPSEFVRKLEHPGWVLIQLPKGLGGGGWRIIPKAQEASVK